MKLQPQITLKDIDHSDAVETKILEKVNKLGQFYDRIMAVRVAVESPQRRHHQGKLYTIRIDITVPGKELVVNRMEHEDLYVVIRDAFDAAKRQLEAHAERVRGETKIHEEAPRGRVAKLYREEGYGYITTHDEREIYFHRNSVIDPDFDRLREGVSVVFLEEQGKKGPQAVRVAVSK